MPTPDQMVVTAAQAELRPLGLQRHKRTRIWVEDRGWWLLFAEFERAGAETHVGVGVTWLWSGTASVSYDLGGRLYWREETGDFATEHPRDGHTWVRSIHYADDGQFSTGLKQITGIVRRRVEQLRQEITTPAYVARLLSAPQSRVGATSWWHTFHTGAAAGLSGDTELARRQFARIRPDRMAEGWERDLGRRAAALLALADDPPELYRRLSADISETRSRLGLPETPPGTPPEPQW